MKKAVALLAGVWLGMQLTAGYVVAPLLFRALPKLQAGALAGRLFDITAYAGLAVWAWVCLILWRSTAEDGDAADKRLAVLLWLALAANQFLVALVIEAHKSHTQNWLLSLAGGSFGMWHGISSLIYLLCTVLAAVSVWRISPRMWQ